MKVVRYNASLEEEWDDFVWASRNGTLFHTQRFISYHPAERFDDCSLLFQCRGKLVAVFPATIQVRDGERVLHSHPGTSYGGPVLAFGTGIREISALILALVDFAQENELHAIEMRLSPRIFHRCLCEELDFALEYHRFAVTQIELSSAVPLDLEIAFHRNVMWQCRNAIREGIEIRESNDWAIFWSVLIESLAWHEATPTHTLAEIQRLCALFPDRIKLFGAYRQGALIAGTVVFVCNDVTCHTFYIARICSRENSNAQALLLSRVAEWAREQGFHYINFGISTEDGGRVINWGLFWYKERLGAHGVVRRYYRWSGKNKG